MVRKPGQPHKGWKAAARWARRRFVRPVPPVPLPVYPPTSMGWCRTCGKIITLVGVVFPAPAKQTLIRYFGVAINWEEPGTANDEHQARPDSGRRNGWLGGR